MLAASSRTAITSKSINWFFNIFVSLCLKHFFLVLNKLCFLLSSRASSFHAWVTSAEEIMSKTGISRKAVYCQQPRMKSRYQGKTSTESACMHINVIRLTMCLVHGYWLPCSIIKVLRKMGKQKCSLNNDVCSWAIRRTSLRIGVSWNLNSQKPMLNLNHIP